MDWAAQFSPFAALTGYGDAVKETARLTENRIELDEYEKAALDEHKADRMYLTVSGMVKKLDAYKKGLIQGGILWLRMFFM